MILTDEITETRLQEFRARVLSRLRKPCTGRFDPTWDIETEFNDNVQTAKYLANELIKSTDFDVDKYYFAAIVDEIEWAEDSVHRAWKNQSEAMERAKNFPKVPKLDPSQTTLC